MIVSAERMKKAATKNSDSNGSHQMKLQGRLRSFSGPQNLDDFAITSYRREKIGDSDLPVLPGMIFEIIIPHK